MPKNTAKKAKKSTSKTVSRSGSPQAKGKRKALGRGLSALMAAAPEPVQVPEQDISSVMNQSIESSASASDKPLKDLPAHTQLSSPVSLEVLSGKLADAAWREPSLSDDGSETPRTSLAGEETPPSPSALTPETVQALEVENKTNQSDETEGFVYQSIEKLIACESQPRKSFAEEELRALAASITQSGLLQPILVRPLQDRGLFEIVAGERRFRAAKLAGLDKVPVHVKTLSEREAFELSIVENVQREDLDPVEEARAYQRLVDEFSETHSDIAQAVGKDRATIANMLRLLQLPSEVLKFMQDGKISAGHGRALLAAPERLRLKLAQRVISEKLSVRATEALASGRSLDRPVNSNRAKSSTPGASGSKSPAILELENRIRQSLGTKVQLEMSDKEKGELKISFFSKAELNSFLERLGI